MAKKLFYAVRTGRDGPNIYTSWNETFSRVSGYPGARYKSFSTLQEAENFISGASSSRSFSSPFSSTPLQSPPVASSSRTNRNLTLPSSTHPLYVIDTVGDLPPEPEPDAIGIDGSSGDSSYTTAPGTPQSRVSNENTSHVVSPQIGADFVPFGPEDEGPEDELDEQQDEPAPDIELSEEQQAILDDVMEGQSLFFTGSAGTGKSVVLREIIQSLRRIPGKKVAVTASTGIAGVNVGGSTLHSFAGIGLGKENGEILISKVSHNAKARERWQTTDVLIIDEISMVDGSLFDKLEAIARAVRQNERPFGGLQLVISGDFYQLPPVPDRHDGAPIPIAYAFEAKTWSKCIPKMVTLSRVFRQKDERFISILNEMRLGTISDEASHVFSSLSREVVYTDGVQPTELFGYPLRSEVQKANAERLAKLPLPEKTFVARDFPGHDIRGNKIPQKKATELLDQLVVLGELTLRVGAQVMLIQNMIQGHLVNGSIGIIESFLNVRQARADLIEIAKVDEKNAKNAATPVYAQGTNAPPGATLPEDTEWPVVKFTNGRKLLLPPVGFSVVNVFGGTEAQRDQVPLILAWALSIHKSQGQTLQRVKVNLGRIFEKGQAYVAISRATSLEALQILNFQPSRVQAAARVIEFSKKLTTSTAQTALTQSYAQPLLHDDEYPSDMDDLEDRDKGDSDFLSDSNVDWELSVLAY